MTVHGMYVCLEGVVLEPKYPMVNILFLNEWGDRQVSPYMPDENLTGTEPNKRPPSTQHYAIFVDEKKIKVWN